MNSSTSLSTCQSTRPSCSKTSAFSCGGSVIFAESVLTPDLKGREIGNLMTHFSKLTGKLNKTGGAEGGRLPPRNRVTQFVSRDVISRAAHYGEAPGNG